MCPRRSLVEQQISSPSASSSTRLCYRESPWAEVVGILETRRDLAGCVLDRRYSLCSRRSLRRLRKKPWLSGSKATGEICFEGQMSPPSSCREGYDAIRMRWNILRKLSKMVYASTDVWWQKSGPDSRFKAMMGEDKRLALKLCADRVKWRLFTYK